MEPQMPVNNYLFGLYLSDQLQNFALQLNFSISNNMFFCYITPPKSLGNKILFHTDV